MDWVKKILKFFEIEGDFLEIVPQVNGLINKTFLLSTTKQAYIVQKINRFVFKRPKAMMDNIETVTEHLQQNGMKTLRIIRTKNGDNCLIDGTDYYRVYEYIKGCFVFDKKPPLDVMYEMGKCVGSFQQSLLRFKRSRLRKHLVGFHNTFDRYRQLLQAYEGADVLLKEETRGLKEIVDSFVDEYGLIDKALKDGIIPHRIVHNDTKFNNIMFDCLSRRSVCLIDLDTVGIGSGLTDYGDSLRMLASTVLEDSDEFNKIDFLYPEFIRYTIGFLEKMDDLKDEEIRLLGKSIFLITIECGIRFLTDYLSNNQYFKIEYPKHNLVRAKNQLYFAVIIHRELPRIEMIIKSLSERIRR